MLYNNKKIVTKNSDDLKCIETLDLDHIEPAVLTDVKPLLRPKYSSQCYPKIASFHHHKHMRNYSQS